MTVSAFLRPRRPARGVLLAGVLLLSVSCSGGREPVYPVRGTVLDDRGRPAVGALLVFHPADGGDGTSKPVGRVDESGAFTLTTYQQGDGAPSGEYLVTVEWPAPRKAPFEPEGTDRLQSRYRDPKRSPFRFTVEKRPDNELPAIRLR